MFAFCFVFSNVVYCIKLGIYSKQTNMASIRDKIKSKIKPKIQPETMECFDQNSLNLSLIQGKNHLTEIRLQCTWNNNKYNIKTPKFKCQWYNRTEQNYQQIIGIEEQTYQPSILDISSIIQVTCIPQLPGVNYEGMPILLKSQPIMLAVETQSEAKKMKQKGKGKFIVNLMDIKLSNSNIPNGVEALLQYQKGQISVLLLKVADTNNHIAKIIDISQQYPKITISRSNIRKVTMEFGKQESCVVLFKNNQVRDTFCLFIKLYQAQKALKELSQPSVSQTLKEQIKQEEKHQNIEEIIEEKKYMKQQQTQNVDYSEEIKNQSNNHNDSTIRQNSTTDLLQLLSLKEQIKRLQAQNYKHIKELQAYRQKSQNLQSSLLQSNERVQNASKNYFTLQQELAKARQTVKILQEQIKSLKNHESSKQEQFLYYTNEIKIINQQKSQLQLQLKQLQKKYDNLVEQADKYRELYGTGEGRSYNELMEDLKRVQETNLQLRLKNEFYYEEREKFQEAMKSSRQVMEQLQAEKKHIEKKYESLTNQLSSSTISPTSPKKERSNENNSLSNSFIFQQALPPLQSRESFMKIINADSENRQREILDLKRQLKEYIQQNNYIRSLLSKEKKPSSKTQLKLELMQAKKIVGRLSEAIGQKQSMLVNLRQINKQINRRNENLEQHCQELLQRLQGNS